MKIKVPLEKLTAFRSHLKHLALPTAISLFLVALGILIASVMLTGHLPPHAGPGYFGVVWFIVSTLVCIALWLPDTLKEGKSYQDFLRSMGFWGIIWFVWMVLNYSLYVICVVKLHWLITVL